MGYSIKLTRYEVTNIDWTYYSTFFMKVVAEEAEGEGFDPYIFLYRRLPQSPYQDGSCDLVSAIAGMADMAAIPIGEPDRTRHFPWFRWNVHEGWYQSMTHAMDTWNAIKEQARILVSGMEKFNRMTVAEELWIPDRFESFTNTYKITVPPGVTW